MDDDMDIEDELMDDEEVSVSGTMRWLPRLVVAATLIGFVALAWYAYETGTQSIREEDLVIVEADKTPIKEKPEDPGGMKFPNQDKTVFETFAGNAQTPPKVERVMPPPEEPMAKQMDLTETKTWVNEDLKKKEEAAAQAKPEQIIGAEPAKPVIAPAVAPKPTTTTTDIKPAAPADNIVSFTMDKSAKEKTQVVTAEKPVEVGIAEVKTQAVVAPAPKADPKVEPAKPVVDTGSAKVQLGAYRSEKEARDSYAKMQKKFSSLAAKSPIIIKADLGAKGIFYRLRVGGFASDAEAKKFCGSLSAKGQACIVAK